MKRTFSIILTFLLLMTVVAGCGTQNKGSGAASGTVHEQSHAETSSTSNSASTQVAEPKAIDTNASFEIRFVTFMTEENRTKLLENTEKKFKEKWPNVTFTNDSSSDYAQKLKLEFGSGSGPDMVYVDDLNQQTLQQGNYLMDITQDVVNRGWIDKQIKGAVEFNNLRTPGKYYSVPFLMAPVVMYYNKDIFTKLGVQPPKTIDEMVGIMDKAKAAGYIPMENAGANNYNLLWMVYHIIYAKVPKSDIEQWYYQKATSDSVKQGFIDAFKTMYDWGQKGYFRKNFSAVEYDNIPKLYAQGKTAMVADGDWNLAAYDQSKIPTGIFTFPNGTNIIVNATDGAWALNAKLDPQKKPACLDFIDTFMNPDVIKMWYEGGLTPSVKFDATGAKTSPLKLELNAAVANTALGFYLDNAVPGLLDVMIKNTQLLMLGKETPEKCWEEINIAYEKQKNAAGAK